jgi:hypothetical protein
MFEYAMNAVQNAGQPSAAENEYATAWHAPDGTTGATGNAMGGASAAPGATSTGQLGGGGGDGFMAGAMAAPGATSSGQLGGGGGDGFMAGAMAAPGATSTGQLGSGGVDAMGMAGAAAKPGAMPTIAPVAPTPASKPSSAEEYASAWHGNASPKSSMGGPRNMLR